MHMAKAYYNGSIITMSGLDQKGMGPEAVLVSSGVIKKVGTVQSVREICKKFEEDVEWVDLKGKCLMPAFIDAHSHIVMNGQMALFADLSACESFEDIVDVLKEYKAEHSVTDSGVIVGWGYDHNFLVEKKHPVKEILDKVSIDIPVIVLHISGHLLCVNSRALQLAQITEDTQNPEGGAIGRKENSSEPNGYLEESALAFVQSIIQDRLAPDIRSVMEGMQDSYIQNGITTVQDGASTEDNINLLKKMAASGDLKIDVVAYPLIANQGADIIAKNKNLDGQYENHLKIGGYKIILDGSPQGRSAWLSEPYEGIDKAYCGYPCYTDEAVKQYIMRAVEEKKQILAHCNGDAASEQFINAYEECMGSSPKYSNLRPVMIHCQTVRNDQLDRMAELQMIASIFIGHVWFWGDVHLVNLGERRARRISPVKDAIDRGVVVNFHQDTPVTKPDMMHSVWCAVARVSRDGKVIGPEQRIHVYDALKAVTINAAYEYFEEDTKGSIEEGKRADIVILSESPLEVETDRIKDIQVVETIKDGETIYRVKD